MSQERKGGLSAELHDHASLSTGESCTSLQITDEFGGIQETSGSSCVGSRVSHCVANRMVFGKRFSNSTEILMRFDLADTCILTGRGNGAHGQNKVKIVSLPVAFRVGLAQDVVDKIDCVLAVTVHNSMTCAA